MLTVYKASAGSGKTFQLVGEYLKLLISNPYSYRQILAVTFTNKATTEMKSRILEQLNLLSDDGETPYLRLLEKELSMTEVLIRSRAKQALKNILHDYSRFSVSTIDSFTQRIIKAFNREMGISPHFILEIDNELILEEAVDRLLAKVDTDKQLRKWLVDFSREKIMENRSQQIETDIKLLGKELFKEKFQVFFPETNETVYARENLNTFRKELERIIAWYENALRKIGEKAVSVFENNGLEVEDFSGKGRGIGAYFVKLSNGDLPDVTPSVVVHAEDVEKWYTRTSPKKDIIHQLAENQLQPLLREIIAYVFENGVLYKSAIEVRKQLRILGILTDLKEEIKLLLQEKGILQLSDSNLLLSKIIGESDAPFIYEKVGNRFNYYMLDEFQDTSLLQWKNFKPLVANALSENNSVLLVGDVKQSIYRWRNSDWNILASQIHSDFPLFPPEIITLEKNWRSRKNIIDFNNSVIGAFIQTFGENLFEEFDDSQYFQKFRDIYLNFRQESGNSSAEQDGRTEINFLDDEEFEENSARLLVDQVKKLQDSGLKASETAILVRKKDEGALIVETFMKAAREEENAGYNLSVLSNESLFLYASRGVNFVILVVELLIEPEGKIQKTSLLHLWLSWLKPVQENKLLFPEFLPEKEKTSALSAEAELETVFEEELGFKFRQIQQKVSHSSIDETVVLICDEFRLFKMISELPFLQTLIDKAAEIKFSLSNDLSNFLFWWKTKGYNTSVSVNEELDSIRLLTIHKSKGLEFEAVLLPYFNFDSSWVGNQAPVLWCSSSAEPFNQFPLLPVKAGSGLAGTVFRHDYLEEKISSLIDTLNLIYVAFTRAKSALFITCKMPAERKDKKVGKTVNALLQNALGKMSKDELFSKCWNADATVFAYGNLPAYKSKVKKAEDNFLNVYQFRDFNDRIQLRLNSEGFLIENDDHRTVKNTGKLVHEILSSVKTEEDIERACNKSLNEGSISKTEGEEILKKFRKSMNHPEIKRWFDGNYRILNERNLLLPGKILRPDRIMINGNNALVVDYKWGEIQQKKYHRQVAQYAEALKKCGFEKVEGFIWYINLEVVEKVGEWS